MATRSRLTPGEVVERLNRSLEEELARLEQAMPTSNEPPSSRTAWEAPGYHVRVNASDEDVLKAGIPRMVAGTPANSSPNTRASTRRRNASLLGKLEASRLHALEALSSVLFEGDSSDHGRGTTMEVQANFRAAGTRESFSPTRQTKKGSFPLEQRLRSKAAALVEEERRRLLLELHRELDDERRAFAARKPAIFEEAFRRARAEQTSALQKKEQELRMLLARSEVKDLKYAAYERLSVAHSQEKERILMRLRRSLGRGKEFSVGGLREALWTEAQEKRSRALKEGEAAFEQSCRLVREQWEQTTQRKIDAMRAEAAKVEQAHLKALRERESLATETDLLHLADELERGRADAEHDLKRQLETEAVRSVNVAVENCTARHKEGEREAAARASETLRRTLEAAADEEKARSQSAFERESRLFSERRSALIAAVEEGLQACSLKTLSEKQNMRRLSFSSFPNRDDIACGQQAQGPLRNERIVRASTTPVNAAPEISSVASSATNLDTDTRNSARPDNSAVRCAVISDDVQSMSGVRPHDCAASRNASSEGVKARRAAGLVRELEGVAQAAEREHAKRARELVGLRTATALRRRREGGETAVTHETQPGTGKDVSTERVPRRDSVGMRHDCERCSVLFEANEGLLRDVRARGLAT